ncbi:hypothetical protein THAOC_22068 [Thalassiosira oceanica]|uniref:Uncharacterized protein n=1 Tax=Thalassiosira oceanica TaxID=159749 RepID=K0RVK0_THAOC|nr:hypothetical protein THAOC_22068 [Thalassiosira oceanica]|eukprot:EJK57848.1 hypothetical protein THAOC_22068 [Thalassiosira oceanica]
MPCPTRDASSGGREFRGSSHKRSCLITAAAAAHTGHDHRKGSRSQSRTGREDGRPERRRGKSKSRRSSNNRGPGRNRPKVEQERKRRERKRASVVTPAYSHVYQGTAPTSTVVQAASFASTAEWEHMPRAERESRDASRRAKRDLLSRVMESFGERNTPRDDIEYSKPVLFKVRGGALLPLEPAELARCTVLDVDLLRIKHPSSPDKGLVCNSSKSDCPVFVLAPRDPALEELGVGDADFNARIVSALEDVTRVQKSSTIRSCEIICEGRYTGSFGVVVPRGEAGTRQFSYHKDKLGDEVYDLVVT